MQLSLQCSRAVPLGLQLHLQAGFKFNFEYRIRSRSGLVTWLSARNVPLAVCSYMTTVPDLCSACQNLQIVESALFFYCFELTSSHTAMMK